MENPRRRSTINIKTLMLDDEVKRTREKPYKLQQHEAPEVLFIEPFYGGSHKQLIDTLRKCNSGKLISHLITLSSKKWPWRARCSSLLVSELIPTLTTERVLFCSSVLNLAELLGLCPALQRLRKIVYFHENQLVYPIRDVKQRDFQFGYNQITTCLAADLVIFNSNFNKESFLVNLGKYLKLMPDYRPKNLREKIEPKCQVLYFPHDLPESTASIKSSSVVRLLWGHRWEFDKGPEQFVNVLVRLKREGCRFEVVIAGETFTEVPKVFAEAQEVLKDEIVHMGFVEDKSVYFKMVSLCHVAVSTAQHEFFGVSMMEASCCGCFPLVPNRLVYPEFYPAICLYEDEEELFVRLKGYCLDPGLAIEHRGEINLDFSRFSVDNLMPEYLKAFNKGFSMG